MSPLVSLLVSSPAARLAAPLAAPVAAQTPPARQLLLLPATPAAMPAGPPTPNWRLPVPASVLLEASWALVVEQ